jgi:hypothetical protein
MSGRLRVCQVVGAISPQPPPTAVMQVPRLMTAADGPPPALPTTRRPAPLSTADDQDRADAEAALHRPEHHQRRGQRLIGGLKQHRPAAKDHRDGQQQEIFPVGTGMAAPRSGPVITSAEHIGAGKVVLDVCRYNPVTQILDEQHVRIGADGITLSPISLRLAGPLEFDLMARIAGLRLVERCGGWNGEPFNTASWRHVSVYARSGRLEISSQDSSQRDEGHV